MPVFPRLTTVGLALVVETNNPSFLMNLAGGFPALTSVGSDLRISGNQGVAGLSTAFAALSTIDGALQLVSLPGIADLDSCFPQLVQALNGIVITDCGIASINNGFPFLSTCESIEIGNCPNLVSIVGLAPSISYLPGSDGPP